jgi:IS30 family transposase
MTLYKRLSLEERKRIKELLSQSKGVNVIAKELNRAPSTISREIKQTVGDADVYYPAIAHMASLRRQKSRRLDKRKIGTVLSSLIDKYLMIDHFSPEQISHSLKINHDRNISTESIYQYIYRCEDMEKRKQMIKCLRRRRRERRRRGNKNEKRGKIPNMVSIHERPEAANLREEVGHWEGDLVIGKGHRSAVLTLVERLSRYTIIVPIWDNMTSLAVIEACRAKLGQLPQALQKSLTYDRGKEMFYHEHLTRALGIKVYFADPHAPWQRGTNENTNGLIREFFPKGTDFCLHQELEFQLVEALLNRRPRKVLGFKTPKEVFESYLAAA